MATTDIKNLENIVNEILEKVKNLGEKKAPKNYDKTLKDINSKLDTIDEKMVISGSANNNPSELINKIELLETKIEQQSQDFLQKIQSAFDDYVTHTDISAPKESIISENIKDFVSIVTNEMMDLKTQFEKFNTDFTEININTSMAVSKEILSMKNYVLALNDTIDSIKNKIESYNPQEELVPVISENVANSVAETTNTYLNNFKTEAFNLLAKVSEGIATIIDKQKILEGLEIAVGEIREGQQKNKDDIVKIISSNIAEENKKLLPQILQMVNSISFDDAAEEIKDGLYAVNENLGIVNKNIETGAQASSQILEQVNTMSKEISDISSSLPKAEVFSKIDETVQDISKAEIINKVLKIDSVLETISAEFNILTKGSKVDTGDYLYTLLDLEADISKVRIILDELTHSVKDDKSLAESVTAFVEKTAKMYSDPDYKAILEQFDTLNDDITSISKRTNKLILTSDDAAVKLEKNIQDFQNIMTNISSSIQNFENSGILKIIAEKTNNIQKLVKNSIQADNAINEAFVYLASWIDNTSAEIKSIKDEVSGIKNLILQTDENIKDEISEIKNLVIQTDENIRASYSNTEKIIKTNKINIPDSVDNTEDLLKIEKLIKETNKKITDNSKNIEALDIKQSLDVLTEQIQILNENITANKTTNKKIDKIEKQIQQLITYVEE